MYSVLYKKLSTKYIFCTQYMDVCLFMFFLSLWVGYQSNLEEMQAVLNSTEVSLHHLTALVDCRSLHMVRVLIWNIEDFF